MTRARFHPIHVEHTGEFRLELAPGHAFPLFSPEGERAWVAGWDPEYLHPPHPSTAPGTVFRTTHNGEETLWLILRYDPRDAVAEYGRFSPGSRLGTVLVECHPEGPRSTHVRVTYALTSLGPAGNTVLEDLTPARYAEMLEGWREAILESQRPAEG